MYRSVIRQHGGSYYTAKSSGFKRAGRLGLFCSELGVNVRVNCCYIYLLEDTRDWLQFPCNPHWISNIDNR